MASSARLNSSVGEPKAMAILHVVPSEEELTAAPSIAYSFHITLQPHCGQGAGGRSAWTASSGSGVLLCWSGLAASRPVAGGSSRLHSGQITRLAPPFF